MKQKVICFAGLDGSGKTTQAKLASEWMNQNGLTNDFIRLHTEPTKSEINEVVRKSKLYIIENRLTLSGTEIEFIKEAFHVQMKLRNLIHPALQMEKNLVFDRYVETFDAYTSVMAKTKNWVRLLNDFPQPDLYFFLDVAPEVSYSRILQSGRRISDHETLDALEQARNYYLDHREHYSFVVIDGNRPLEEISAEIQSYIWQLQSV